LPANKFPYSFALFDRPEEASIDHCVFYFLRDGKSVNTYNTPYEVAILSKVFRQFKDTFEKIDTHEIVDAIKVE